MSRYIERAENVARFVDVNLNLSLDSSLGMSQQWAPLVATSGDFALFQERYGEATRENVIEFLTFDAKNPNSILSCLRAVRENARTVRETISSEMWEQANKLYLMINEDVQSGRVWNSPHEFYADLKLGCHLFQGITDSTMSHNEAWQFIRLARKLERADKTTRILDVKYFLLLPHVQDVGTPIDDIHWAAVLRSVSGFEMYRKRFGRISPLRVVDFLILDGEFPRSVRYCLQRAAESLHKISGTPMGTFRNAAEQRIGHLRAELDYTSVDSIIGQGLHEFLDDFQTKLNTIDDSVFETFIAMRPMGTSAARS
ncbi:MAG: alpha-E domain-containing protein [Acidobacteria bacterium]|nr:alpha-E domain-containing protein [Acidobacteriota bacterium]